MNPLNTEQLHVNLSKKEIKKKFQEEKKIKVRKIN